MIPTDELEDYPKRTSLSRRLPVVVIGLAIVGALAYGTLKPAPIDANAGHAAPSFELELLDGSGTLSDTDLRGGPVVLNFWASWCVPCRDEMPLFEKKWQAYRDQGVTFVGVVVRDTEASARDFIKAHHITYPVVWDPDQTLVEALGVDPLPETFFIDSSWHLISGVQQDMGDGSGATRYFGSIDADQLQERIDALLGGSS
ncbi:MAG: cytochrome c biosis protein CcmG, thiol:disulfide interchange protein DsbE [Actinomycetota bacterium]|jgi:cytochrome c biogenesis protein CcmG/thiol:disulfide interchange protein DsbE|nr:cytochrome c biosis protein CcmG, thiol:disulfide interchange protein DsbE [Actinomycetota bacterium]